MGLLTVTPILPVDLSTPLFALEVIVAVTTIWSGLSYVTGAGAVRLSSVARKPPLP